MAVAAIDFRTRRTRELFCCFVHGAGRLLPAAADECLSVGCFRCAAGCVGSFGAAAKQALQAPSPLFPPRAGSPQLVVIPPGVLRVEYGSARGKLALFSSGTSSPRELDTRIITHFHQGLAPPHDRWRRCGATRAVFSPASAFGLTPDDPVLSPSNRQTSPPKNSKTTRKAPKPQPTDAAS